MLQSKLRKKGLLGLTFQRGLKSMLARIVQSRGMRPTYLAVRKPRGIPHIRGSEIEHEVGPNYKSSLPVSYFPQQGFTSFMVHNLSNPHYY